MPGPAVSLATTSPPAQWMDTALQRRRREQHATTGARTQLPSASIGGLLGGGAQSRSSNEPLPYTPYAAAAAAAAAQSGEGKEERAYGTGAV